MKKMILAALSALTLGLTANAQDLSFILQGGYQGAKLTSFDAQELASGFRIGAALDWEFLDLGLAELSLQPGVNFSQKGTNLIGTLQNGQSIFTLANNPSIENAINAAMKMNYIDIPVLLNARFDVPLLGNVFVQAGPYVAFGIGSSTNISTGNETVDNAIGGIADLINGGGKQNFDVFKDNIMEKLDYGLQFGGGIEWNRILLSAGYQLGLKNLSKAENTVQENLNIIGEGIKNSLATGTKNSSFYVSVGFRF